MKIDSVPVDAPQIGPRHRQLVPEKVAALVESIREIGLLQPITVYTPDDATAELVAGAHRLEAARQLGWEWIPAIFITCDELRREMAEIDENLIRAELGPSQRASQVARRKEIHEILHPETKHGATGGTNVGKGRTEVAKLATSVDRFTSETAKKTGQSERAIQRDAARGKKIAPDVLQGIEGTDLDKGTVLDALKKLKHDEQRQAVERVTSGASKTIDDAYEFITGEQPKSKSKPKSKPKATTTIETEKPESHRDMVAPESDQSIDPYEEWERRGVALRAEIDNWWNAAPEDWRHKWDNKFPQTSAGLAA